MRPLPHQRAAFDVPGEIAYFNTANLSPQLHVVRAAGEAALCAVYPDARNPFTFPEISDLEAWSVPETWVMGMDRANHYVDITASFDRKMAALHAHVSQHPEPDGLEEMVRGWNALNAEAGGLPEGHVAEAFWVLEGEVTFEVGGGNGRWAIRAAKRWGACRSAARDGRGGASGTGGRSTCSNAGTGWWR